MNKLKEYFKSYYVLNDVSGLLFWDNATNLPKKSIESRSEQMSILSNFTDRIFRSEDIQEEIQKAENTKLSEADSMSLKLMKSIIVKENAIDPDLKSLLIKKKLTCEHLWREARSKKAQKKATKNITSDVMNRAIPHLRPISVIELCTFKKVLSFIISRHHINIVKSIRTRPAIMGHSIS